MKTLILGGGLAGLSCSYHLGHQNCQIIERNPYLGGHATTHQRDNAFWDEGPHVSFTKHESARNFLTWSADRHVLDYPTNVGNFFAGHWIPHPAQSNLCAVPEPLAGQCYDDFLDNQNKPLSTDQPKNYQEWLDQAFGITFSRTFPHAYTRKYWTCDPSELSTDWVGGRVYKPDLETVVEGYRGKPKPNTHYINSVRYPANGGFGGFLTGLKKGANVIRDEVVSIDLDKKCVFLANGKPMSYEKLVSSLPLDQFVDMIVDVPPDVKKASTLLSCSSLLLVNILGTQIKSNPYHWLYVYDEDKYSTRVSQTHLLAPSNTPDGLAGIQVEVYASKYRQFSESFETITAKVCQEILEMNLVDEIKSVHFQIVPYANIIFDHHRRKALDTVLEYLANFGLIREYDDLDPMTDWSDLNSFNGQPDLALAGRFGQWKYYWTDDCLLRGMQLASSFESHP